jgi:hypothetical protein
MCPVCIASTAALVAGAGSTGGLLAVCIVRLRTFFRAHGLHMSVVRDKKESKSYQSIPEMKGEITCQ